MGKATGKRENSSAIVGIFRFFEIARIRTLKSILKRSNRGVAFTNDYENLRD